MKHRIFLAINLPEEIKNELFRTEKEIDGLFPEELSRGLVKWVKKNNLHLTLLFLGYIEDKEIFPISQIVKEIVQSVKKFPLQLAKVCYGPPKKTPPHLIWLEIKETPALLQIVERLKNQLSQAGILTRYENRKFTPHITLGRIRTWQWRQIEADERPEIEREINLQFEVKSIDIMESILKRTGPEYQMLESVSVGE